MSSLEIDVNTDYQYYEITGDGRHPVSGVVITNNRWNNTPLQVQTRYTAQRPTDYSLLNPGNIVQLKIKNDRKSYAYMVVKKRRMAGEGQYNSPHTEYLFKPSHGSAKTVTVINPDAGPKLFYYGSEEIKYNQLEVYAISDHFLLNELDRPELIASTQI